MRDLNQFSASEWLSLRPLGHALKQLRNDLLQAAYVRARPAALEQFLVRHTGLRGGCLALVVAFEQPWVLDWLIRLARRHLAGATLVVCDNSRRPAARQAIERVCRERDAPYLPLPPNATKHVNRSHGMALTWIWRNVVRALEPRVFGFLDHDLLPMRQVDLAALVSAQPFYGVCNASAWGWSLWAGFSIYDYAAVRALPLNFLYDFSRGLDTGGRNWWPLYRHHERALLRFAERHAAMIRDPGRGDAQRAEIVDQSWLHLAGVSYNAAFQPRADFFARLAQRVEAGATLEQLQAVGR